ncbi:MAG TPA: fumarylacetoacetate hydrolase, partial [Albitalea sp.]
MNTLRDRLTPTAVLPADRGVATLIGRAWVPQRGGPVPVLVRSDGLHDLSGIARTVSELLELPAPLAAIAAAGDLPRIANLADTLANCDPLLRDTSLPWLLAPCDLQALKASGVTFVASMLERVIEEKTRGDASRADAARRAVVAVIGDNLSSVRPGSPEAARLKDVLVEQGMWSQYLEVGIGPDAEIFT